MRHRVQKKKLSRNTDHRIALLKNLSKALILEGKVETTLAKAKFVRAYVERLVTKAKKGPAFTNLNLVNSRLGSKTALRVLFDDLAIRFKDRNGGYTKITKLSYRSGDAAPMAKIEWVTPKAVPTEKKTEKNEK